MHAVTLGSWPWCVYCQQCNVILELGDSRKYPFDSIHRYIVNLLRCSTARLASVLLPTGTHCWHRFCRQPDESNSTEIIFNSLCWIDSNRSAYRIDSNQLPALRYSVQCWVLFNILALSFPCKILLSCAAVVCWNRRYKAPSVCRFVHWPWDTMWESFMSMYYIK